MSRSLNLRTLRTRHSNACILLCCLALGLAAQAPAGEAYIRPTITGYVEQVYNGSYTYSRNTGLMRYGEYSTSPGVGIGHAFLKFSLDSLPDSIVITNADLSYDQYEHSGGLPVVDIRLIPDPMAMPPHDLYFQIGNARAITSAGPSSDTWVTWDFDSTAGPLLDSCHRAGVACFSIHWAGPQADTYRAAAYGYDSSAVPYLHIVYRSSGINEAQSVPPQRPRLSLAPNPARSAFVTARYDIPVGTRGELILRDALGRTVKTFALDQPGRARLDLRGLAPGVYMATLESAGTSVSRKLVITAR